MKMTRRNLMKALTAATSLAPLSRLSANTGSSNPVDGPFKPTWDSLRQYQIPEWFRDAKFGIWAHWSAQCVPENGDWYAREMYIQGSRHYEHHLKHYGHPTQFGFMEIDNLWKAEKWQPEQLMQLYVNAGAKYFMSLACHHDNFDCFNSRHHDWNAVRVGPKRDIVGTWARTAREHGLKFGVSNHAAHAWHWFQTAYDYDPEGALKNARYDAFNLTREQGRGTWWEGLDPQELYTGRNLVMPDDIGSIQAADEWHKNNDLVWNELPPANNPQFASKWFLRCKDLVDQYKPDLLYFDNTGLPLGQFGMDVVAHYYNNSVRDHGRTQNVVFAKNIKAEQQGAFVNDIERGRAQSILPTAWQTDTCIGDWHYSRPLFEEGKYKSVQTVIHMLIDIVSKNGNLLLSIPVRGNGEIDEYEHQFLTDMAAWIRIHGEGIYGTRPFFVEGEGLPDVQNSKNFNEMQNRPYTAQDIRFTTKGETLYAFVLGKPLDRSLTIKTLTRERHEFPRAIRRVDVLGMQGSIDFTHDTHGLMVKLPEQLPNDFAFCLRIR